MKVVAVNGSARRDGNTAILIRKVFSELEKEGIETKLYQLSGQIIRGCMACRKCFENKNKKCVIPNDPINEIIADMETADGVILGSPTYFSDVSAEMKALIDRVGYVARGNGHLFKRKAGAAVIAVRRAGSIHAFDTINHFFTISQMMIVGSSYWNMGVGMLPGDVENDAEGMDTMIALGQNMAWLIKKISA